MSTVDTLKIVTGQVGSLVGFINGVLGSIIPPFDTLNNQVFQVLVDVPATPQLTFSVSPSDPSAVITPEDYFDSLEIFDDTLDILLITLSRFDPTYGGYTVTGNAQWIWLEVAGLVNTNEYTLTLKKDGVLLTESSTSSLTSSLTINSTG